jgi:hypothetical protein
MVEQSAQKVLAIWDFAQNRQNVDKALAILACFIPDVAPEALSNMPLGQRNTQLIKIREELFGSEMTCLTQCVHCREPVEFVLHTQDFYKSITVESSSSYYTVNIAEYTFKFRLLNSEDLRTSLKEINPAAIRRRLIQCSILEIKAQDGTIIQQEELPEQLLHQYIEHLYNSDPQVETQLTLTCSICSQQWQDSFDITHFLWKEIDLYAKQLLQEVHFLAAVYGWSEKDILTMSFHRRQYYLNVINV